MVNYTDRPDSGALWTLVDHRMYKVKSYYYTIYVCLYVIYDFALKTIWALCPTQWWALCPICDTSKYFELSAVFILAHPNQLHEHAAHTTYFRHIFCICLNVLPFSRSTRISMVVFL